MRGDLPNIGLLRLWGYNTALVLMFVITLFLLSAFHIIPFELIHDPTICVSRQLVLRLAFVPLAL